MRRFVIFLYALLSLIIVLLCAGCSPQRQLARLLAKHPELRSDTLLHIPVQRVTPHQSASIVLDNIVLRNSATPTELRAGMDDSPQTNSTDVPPLLLSGGMNHSDSSANRGASTSAWSTQRGEHTVAQVRTGISRATILQTDTGLILMAEQLPDTLRDTLEVHAPRIVVETKTQVIESPIRIFFRILGVVTFFLVLLFIVCRLWRR